MKQRSRRPHLPSSILTLRTKVLNPRRQRFVPYLSHFCPLAASIREPLHQKASVEVGPPSPPLMQRTPNGCRADYVCQTHFLGQQRLKVPSRQKLGPDWNKWRKRAKCKERRRNQRQGIMTLKRHTCNGDCHPIIKQSKS